MYPVPDLNLPASGIQLDGTNGATAASGGQTGVIARQPGLVTPAHLKCSSIGASLSIPITNGRLNLGTWQGIYLCEHRDDGGTRSIVVTIAGD